MTQKEFHDYFLAHREDQDAFHAYVDKLHREGNWVQMPLLKSLDDLNQRSRFLEREKMARCLRLDFSLRRHYANAYAVAESYFNL